ncbi:unnamed protein product [Cylicocyclus nassatus]|uniref:Uncharacterized protein n=1 Tax=Cylicocyclus nassatus TaxID=53992 RepID=A0AA36HF89_CYLNA|nr:unnamed protein product [Cylicocyclus nassatus]
MHRELTLAFLLILFTTSVFPLRGALFRSGRSFRFRQPTSAEEEAPVEIKRSVLFYPDFSARALDNDGTAWRLHSTYNSQKRRNTRILTP